MKKALSILLSVMMVAGLFVALIPAASAATKSTLSGAVAPPTYTLGEAWYTEDFEDVHSSLTGTNLFNALGWNAGSKSFPSGATLAVVESGENQWVSLKGSASVIPFLTDDRLAGGDYYIEYTQKMISNTGADGQGLGVVSGGYGTTDVQTAPTSAPLGNRRLIWQWNVKERGELDTLAYFPANLSSTDIGHALDIDTSTTSSANGKNARGSLVGKEIRFRIVIDADYGFSAYTLDADGNATPVAYMSSAANVELWKANANLIADYLNFRILAGPVVCVDDIKVGSLVKEEKTIEPGLMISEVSTNARAKFTASDGAEHRFEWIEVYNASTEAKNIYDYAIVRRSGFLSYTKTATTTTADNKTTTTYAISNTLTSTISDSEWYTISYPAEEGGECVVSRTDKDYEYKFTNPVYEDGVLQPGETAILVNASDWWGGVYNADSLTATVEVFKTDYLIGNLGYTEEEVAAMNIFNCSAGKGTTSFGINNTGADLIGLAPLDENGDCPAVGKHFYDSEYVDNYVIDIKKTSGTAKTTTSDTQTVVKTTGIINNHIRMAGHHRYSYSVAHYYSAEYAGAYDASANYMGTSLLVNGKTPGNQTHSVGYVLDDQRRPFAVNYVSDGEIFKTEFAYLKGDYSITTSVPTKEGYTFTGWVDAKGNPASDITSAMAGATYYATWEYTGPVATMLGVQSTYLNDSGRFDIRFVARLGAVENISQIKNVHFELALAGDAITGSSTNFVTKTVYLEYVYRTLSTNFGSATLTEADGTYYVALHINNCPEGVTYQVKPVITLMDGTVLEGVAETYDPVGLRQNIEYMQFSFDDGYKCFQNLTNNDYDSLFDEPFFGWMKDMHDEYGAVFSVYVFNKEFKDFADSEKGALYADEFQANKSWLRLGLHSPANDQSINFNTEGYNTFEVGYDEWTAFLTSAMIVTGNDPDCIDKFHRLHNFAGSDAAISGMIQAGIDFAEATEDTTDTAEDYRPAGFYAADDTRDSYYLSSELSQWLNANDHLNDTGKDLTLIATDIRAEYFNTAPTKFTGADMYEELYLRHTLTDYASTASSMIIFSHENRIQGNSDLVMYSMELACQFAKDFGITFAFSDAMTHETTDHDINTPIAERPVVDDEGGTGEDSGLGSNEDTGVELPEINV